MRKFLTGFYFAWQGITYAFKTQINLRFHFLMSTLVVGAGLLFNVSKVEWIQLILCIGVVIAAELFNTAIEKLTDLVTTEMHPLAKIAKDCAAGAVLIVAICAGIIGLIVFLPHIKGLLG